MTRLTALVLVLAGVLLGAAGTLVLADRGGSEADQSAATQSPVQSPGPVDIGFAQDMAVHHEQALSMSQLALTNTDDPLVSAVARQILVSQASERGTLQGWLVLWRAPQLPSGPAMAWMTEGHEDHSGHSSHESTPMPGMATTAQMARLASLTGAAFDREFIALMQRHHLGGIAMAKYAAAQATLSDVRSFATLMVKDQAEEIAALRRAGAR